MFQIKANLTFWTVILVAAVMFYSGMTMAALFIVALIHAGKGEGA